MKRLGVKGGVAASLATALLLGTGGQAYGFEIEQDNPDLKIRLDNTFRYSAGLRVEKRDPKIANLDSGGGDMKWDKGELFNNRVDLLTEFDYVLRDKTGFRVSTALWYNRANDGKAVPCAAPGCQTSYWNDQFSPYVKRFSIGPSGEVLDAFAFHQFQAGDVPINVKVGKMTQYWGEAIFSIMGIALAQAQGDWVKASMMPGAEVKELFGPTSQIYMQASLTKELSVSAYRSFLQTWHLDRVTDSGLYFSDGPLYDGVDRLVGVGPRDPSNLENKKLKNWGVNARWTPQWFDGGTLGVYYREFDEQIIGGLQIKVAPDFSMRYRDWYADDVSIWGLSAAKTIEGVSIGSELAYRRNTAMLFGSDTYLFTDYSNDGGIRGNALFGVVNAVAYFGKTPYWDQSVLLGELRWDHLTSVSKNAAQMAIKGTAACRDYGTGAPGSGSVWDGCVTKNAFGLNLVFLPSWTQALPSVDVSMPVAFGIGLKGNGPVPGGLNQGAGNYSIGLTANVSNKYEYSVKYIDYIVHSKFNGVTEKHNGQGSSLVTDRGWLSFTFKTSF